MRIVLKCYLGRYDAVTFLKYLDTLRVSESFRSVWIFAESSYKIFDYAKKRVYRIVRPDGSKIHEQGKGVVGKRRKTKGDDNNEEEGEGISLCIYFPMSIPRLQIF